MLLKPVLVGQYQLELRTLFSEYIAWAVPQANELANLDLDAKEFLESDMATIGRLLPPTGRFYLAEMNGNLVGMGGIKQLDGATGEIKRMYVRDAARGQGIGKTVLDQLITDAQSLGYTKIRLDSPLFSANAHRLYESRGFHYIEPYPRNENPEALYPILKFMQLDL